MSESRKLAAIMFTDVVGYTKMMANDEAHAFEVIRRNRDLTKPIVLKHHGSWLKELGDGTLCSFDSAVDAVNCSIEIQQLLKKESDYKLRIGIHLGDIIFDENDVYGDGVNVAARLEPLAIAGSIAISGQVYDAIRSRANIDAVFLGTKDLKNVGRPIRAYALNAKGLPKVEAPEINESSPSSLASAVSNRPATFALSKRMISIAALIFVFVAAYFIVPDGRESNLLSSPYQASIGVLPFNTFAAKSDNEDHEYFSDGLSEELLDNLAKISSLKVPGRTSSFSFKGKNEDLREIARKLNVDHILEGSVRWQGKKLRVTAQLIKADDGFHMWSETYDREMEDIFKIQDEISEAIVKALKLKLNVKEQKAVSEYGTENSESYTHYLLAKQFEKNREFDKSLISFKKAFDLDSNFTQAMLGYAKMLARKSELKNDKELYRQYEDLVKKAYKKNPNLAESQFNYGFLLGKNYSSYKDKLRIMEPYFLKAIKLNPNYTYTYSIYSIVLRENKNFDEAEKILLKAIEIDPLFTLHYANLINIKNSQQKFDETFAIRKKIIDINPNIRFSYPNQMETFFIGENNSISTMLEFDKKIPKDIYKKFPDIHFYALIAELSLNLIDEAKQRINTMKKDKIDKDFNYLLYLYDRDENKLKEFVELYKNKKVEGHYDYLFSDFAYAMGISNLYLDNINAAESYFLKSDPYLTDSIVVDYFNHYSTINLMYCAMILDNQKRFNKLVDLYKIAFTSIPRYGSYGYHIEDVKYHVMLGNSDKAIALFKEAVMSGYRVQFWLDQRSPILTDFFKLKEVQPYIKIIEDDLKSQREMYLSQNASK